MFLSRLNEINGGCEKILPLSQSFWSDLKFLIEWWILLQGADQCLGPDDGPLAQQKKLR